MKRIDEIKKMAKEYADKNDAEGSTEWISSYNGFIDGYTKARNICKRINETA